MSSRRQRYPPSTPGTARDAEGLSLQDRIDRLELAVHGLRADGETQLKRIAAIQAQLDHCLAKVQEFLGARFR